MVRTSIGVMASTPKNITPATITRKQWGCELHIFDARRVAGGPVAG
jgi:hypothetical protein